MEMNRFMLFPNYQYYDDSKTDTNTVTIDSELTKELRNYRIYGNSVQDGTPSPDNPVEIQSLGDYDEATGKYKIPIEVKGKNLFEQGTLSGIGALWETYGNGYKLTAINNGGYSNYVKIPILPLAELKWGQTYTLSFYVEQSNPSMNSLLRVGYIDSGTNGLKSWKGLSPKNNKVNSITFTLPDEQPDNFGTTANGIYGTDSVIFFINIQVATLDTRENIRITDIMLVEGEEPAEYEPHMPTQNYDIFLDEPLRKAGDYADYIDFKNGKVIRHNKRFMLDGSYPVQLADWQHVDGYYAVGYAHNTFPDLAKQEKALLCDKLESLPYGAIYVTHTPTEGICLSGTSAYSIFLRLKTDTITTQAEYKAYLNENPLAIVSALKEPIETDIELPEIQLNKGTNILNVKTTIQPSQIDWQYYK